jgi:predicted nucleic-acid-binding protein
MEVSDKGADFHALFLIVIWMSLKWQSILDNNFIVNGTAINCILLTDQINVNLKDQLQKAAHTLCKVTSDFNFKISALKTKTMTFIGTHHKRSKIII